MQNTFSNNKHMMTHIRTIFGCLLCVLFCSKVLASEQNIQFKTDHVTAKIQTNLGDIHIELYAGQAPVTVKNFVRYVQAGAYADGQFYRVVRLDNDNGTPKIEVIQGSANEAFQDFPSINLETTEQTGIQHLDGVLSMARGAPNTATHEFFICIGPQPSLDFGGMRNPDGQGFAAFGRVTEGMPIVKQIHQIKEALQVEDSYVKGQMLAQPVVIKNISLTNN